VGDDLLGDDRLGVSNRMLSNRMLVNEIHTNILSGVTVGLDVLAEAGRLTDF
jgi:hypothetical protein